MAFRNESHGMMPLMLYAVKGDGATAQRPPRQLWGQGMKRQLVIAALWPSFVVAALAVIVGVGLLEYSPLCFPWASNALGFYSILFLVTWALAILAALGGALFIWFWGPHTRPSATT